MINKRVTIKQVAFEAGVSTQTVSRVLNNRPDVAPETRRRVKKVIKKLGYHPSHIAQSLIRGRSYTLGVVGFGLEYYGPSQTLSGIEKQANELGYSLILYLVRDPKNHNAAKIISDMISRHVEGIIWAVPEIGKNREWVGEKISLSSVPIIFLTRQPGAGRSIVAVDNRKGGLIATQHLLDQGCRNIAIITGPLDWWEARQRKLGWRDALEDRGLYARDELVFEGDWLPDSGERGIVKLMGEKPWIDGVFVCNDQMALGVLKGAREMGKKIPDDLAVIGYDDIPEAAFFYPPLSTVRQDVVALGHSAVRELGSMIETRRQMKHVVKPRTILLQPELIIRESSVFSNKNEKNSMKY
ncbi:MAG: LacI family DNA-binding transcriptional regulator [Spirochaetota bacterium]